MGWDGERNLPEWFSDPKLSFQSKQNKIKWAQFMWKSVRYKQCGISSVVLVGVAKLLYLVRYCCISEHVDFRLLLENALCQLRYTSFFMLCWVLCLVYFSLMNGSFLDCCLQVITASHENNIRAVMPIPSMFFWSRDSFRTRFWCKWRCMGPHSPNY